MDISAEDAAKRGGYGEEKYEKKEMQDRVRELFGDLRTNRSEKNDIVTVDAGRGVNEVAREVWDAVQKATETVGKDGGNLPSIKSW